MAFVVKYTGCSKAQDIMDLDEGLLCNLSPYSDPILHFYEWDGPSATYGYFINKAKLLNLEGVAKQGLTLARRPTGGGIVLHVSDLAFSVLVPSSHEGFHENTLDNYHYINEKVKKALRAFINVTNLKLLPANPKPLDAACQNFCMAKPTIYDVMYEGKKIAGAAQRRKKQGYLHQGTISLALPSMDLLHDILPENTKVLEAMLSNSYTFLGANYKQEDLDEVRKILVSKLKEEFLNPTSNKE